MFEFYPTDSCCRGTLLPGTTVNHYPEAVLISKGMKPADAVLVVSCTGLLGAVVARVCTTTLLTARWRPAWAELQAAPV
ncbi:hypothetical protein ACFW4Q_32090 [Streptomyces rochei]